MQPIPDSAFFAAEITDCMSRDHIGATGGGVVMKAFIGEPADANGNAVPCAYCDRRANRRIGPTRETAEALCSRHEPGGKFVPQARNEARARLRHRSRGLL